MGFYGDVSNHSSRMSFFSRNFKLVLQFKPCPVCLSFKLAENDKDKMAAAVHSREKAQGDVVPVSTGESSPDKTGISPFPLEHSHTDEEGWTTFDEPILYVYAGKGPYVGR